MLVLDAVFFQIIAGATVESSRVGFSHLRSWHDISFRSDDAGGQLPMVIESSTAFAKASTHFKAHASPSMVRAETEATYSVLLSVAAGVTIVSVVVLGLIRYCMSGGDKGDTTPRRFQQSVGQDNIFHLQTIAYFLTMVAAANWSAMNVTFHIASKLGLTALEALFWRSLANFAISSLVVLFARDDFCPRRNRLWLFVRSCCSCGSVIGLYIAIVHMALVEAVALYALVPFFALLFTYPMLGEKPSMWLICIVTVSFTGAMLVIQPISLFRNFVEHPVRMWCSLAAVGAAACAAFGAVVVNRFAADLPANMQVLWFGVLGLVLAPSLMALQGVVPHEAILANLTSSENSVHMIVSIFIIGVSSYLMQLAYCWALMLHRAGYITTIFQCSELSLQWAVGILVLHEALDIWRVVGVCIVIGCGVAILFFRGGSTEEAEVPLLDSPRKKSENFYARRSMCDDTDNDGAARTA